MRCQPAARRRLEIECQCRALDIHAAINPRGSSELGSASRSFQRLGDPSPASVFTASPGDRWTLSYPHEPIAKRRERRFQQPPTEKRNQPTVANQSPAGFILPFPLAPLPKLGAEGGDTRRAAISRPVASNQGQLRRAAIGPWKGLVPSEGPAKQSRNSSMCMGARERPEVPHFYGESHGRTQRALGDQPASEGS